MAQYEVFDFLCKQRLFGNDNYFSSKEVKLALVESGKHIKSVRGDCIKLLNFGFLELYGDFPKKFRVKKSIALKQKKRLLFKQY